MGGWWGAARDRLRALSATAKDLGACERREGGESGEEHSCLNAAAGVAVGWWEQIGVAGDEIAGANEAAHIHISGHDQVAAMIRKAVARRRTRHRHCDASVRVARLKEARGARNKDETVTNCGNTGPRDACLMQR